MDKAVLPHQTAAFAQVADFSAATGLLDYGLLGLLLLLSLTLNGVQFRHSMRQNDALVKQAEKGVNDAREFAEKMHDHSNVLDRAIAVVDRLGAARA